MKDIRDAQDGEIVTIAGEIQGFRLSHNFLSLTISDDLSLEDTNSVVNVDLPIHLIPFGLAIKKVILLRGRCQAGLEGLRILRAVKATMASQMSDEDFEEWSNLEKGSDAT